MQRCFTNKLSIESTLRRRWRVLEYKIDKPAVRRWWRKNILTISMLLLFLFDVSQRRSHFKFPKWVEESLTEEVENVFFALISIRGTEWDKWKLETRLRPACLHNWVPLGDSRKRMTMRLETLNCYQIKEKEEENEYTKENLAEKKRKNHNLLNLAHRQRTKNFRWIQFSSVGWCVSSNRLYLRREFFRWPWRSLLLKLNLI